MILTLFLDFDTLEHSRPQGTELKHITHFSTTAYYVTSNMYYHSNLLSYVCLVVSYVLRLLLYYYY